MTLLSFIGALLCTVAALNFVLCTFLLTRPKRRDALVPYVAVFALMDTLFSLAIGIAYLRAARGLDYDFYYRSGWFGWIAIAPLVQSIFYLKGYSRRAQITIGVILYALWGGILVLCWTTDLVETGAVSLVPFVDRYGPFEHPARALGAIQLLWVLYQFFVIRRASSGRRRQQLDYFLLGCSAYAMSGLVLAGIAQLGGYVHFDPGLVALFTTLWLAAIAYAITRHRLFDVRIVLSRVLEALTVTAAFSATNILFFRVISIVSPARLSIALSSLVAAALMFMTPLAHLLRAAPRVLLLRRRYDYQQIVKESAQALAKLGGVDDIVTQLRDAITRTIDPSSIAIVLRDGENFGDNLPLKGALLAQLRRDTATFVREERALDLPRAELAALDAELGGGELAVGLYYQGALDGVIILGGKKSRDAFFQMDIHLLETLATEGAIALANARLVDELRQAIVARDDFLSVAGHELRTPLTALQLQVQVFRTLSDPARLTAQVPRAERQIARLTRLIDELLDVTRITSGRMSIEREKLDLAETVRETVARFRDDLQRSGGQIDASLTESVVGQWDRIRIAQVVANLVANAVKYGCGRPIEVELTRSMQTAKLTVRDHGIGIKAEDQARIFERFERAISPRQYGGLGLGLWITKQVVEAHGGTISVQSVPDEGSTFCVELPL